jgi:hypothetical protein
MESLKHCEHCKKNKVCQHQQYCWTCSGEREIVAKIDRKYYYQCIYCIFFGNIDNEEEWDSWEELANRVSDLTIIGFEDYKRGVVGKPEGDFYDVYNKGYKKAAELCSPCSPPIEIKKDEDWCGDVSECEEDEGEKCLGVLEEEDEE